MAEFLYNPAMARVAARFPGIAAGGNRSSAIALQAGRLAATFLTAAVFVIATESVARGGFADLPGFLFSTSRPGLTSIVIVFLILLSADALLGRAYQSLLVFAPLVFIPAFVSGQKQLYLSDPLYPSDVLFARQIMELMPVMVKDRPGTAFGMAIGILLAVAGLVYLWRLSRRRFPVLSRKTRMMRLLICLPVIAAFVSIMDYSRYSFIRDRLQVIPMMWDQKENYFHNGFMLAFSLNLPMANVSAPAGFSPGVIDKIPAKDMAFGASRSDKPDVIVVMSESFWDPTRLPGLTLSPDPMPTVRANQSGHIFSPEFGGMTANVEFEALTGFSNAFLPYGSIPYQQYIRNPIPSLATFFRGEGYVARAVHPFQRWFWNRSAVYKSFGFDEFKSEETMPVMQKRGIFASDESLTREIIRQADQLRDPFFFFTVTLQGHGPYEVNRYAKNTIKVEGALPEADRQVLATYAQGVKEADDSLKMLMDWAKTRDRETIIVLFGDHLPPLNTVYSSTGFMEGVTASRKGPLDQMKAQHETPLVIWSNKTGPKKNVGSISPAFLSYQILKQGGFEHPYYTGFLGRVFKQFPIIDRFMLVDAKGKDKPGWSRAKQIPPAIRDYRFLQHDMMFGKRYGTDRFFESHGALYPPAAM